ncbi:MAG: carboxypeptidase regulatory-like domain-containing protein [Terriglobia bacterium]|jgi:hypothetical protein
MRWARALITLAFLPSLLSAQESSPGNPLSPVKPDDLCTLEGVVINGVTGDPIKNIAVTLQPLVKGGQGSNALTDVSGRFAFQNLAPGRYLVQATGLGPNWVFARSGPAGSHRLLALDPGRHVHDLIFRLQPGGVITGTVYDEDSQPVVGAQVQAFPAGHGNRSGISAAGQTNDLGGYRLFGIPAGKYYVVATGSPAFGFRAPTDEVYLPTLYPGTSDAGQALPVEVRAGDEQRGIDLNLILMRGVSVRGRVIMPAAAKSAGAYVQLLPRDAPPDLPQPFSQYGGGSQDGKGTFEIHGVPPGAYYLSANWGDANGFFHGQVPIDVGREDLEGVMVTLLPGFSLQGRVNADPGMPLNFTQLSIYLEPTGPVGMGVGAAKINPDGTFVFEKVFEGDYRLHVAGFPEEFYLRSAKWGGADALASSFNVGREQAGGTLVVDLALDGGRVDGTVLHDQQPVPGAFVALVPDPPNRSRENLYSQTSADPLGRFSLLGLPPGDFKLFAWEPGENAPFRDPEFIKTCEDHGAHVHIEAKKQQSVQLELTPAEEEPQ